MNPNDGRVPRVRHTFVEEGEIKRPFLLPNSQILPSIIQQNSIVSPLAPTPPVSLNGITQVNHPSMSPIAVSAAATISAIPGTPFSDPVANAKLMMGPTLNLPVLPLQITVPYIVSQIQASKKNTFPIITTDESHTIPNNIYKKQPAERGNTFPLSIIPAEQQPLYFSNNKTSVIRPKTEDLAMKVIRLLQTKGPLTLDNIHGELKFADKNSILEILKVFSTTPLVHFDKPNWILADGNTIGEFIDIDDIVGQIAHENYKIQILNKKITRLKEELAKEICLPPEIVLRDC